MDQRHQGCGGGRFCSQLPCGECLVPMASVDLGAQKRSPAVVLRTVSQERTPAPGPGCVPTWCRHSVGPTASDCRGATMLWLETSHLTLLGTYLGKTNILSELGVSISSVLACAPHCNCRSHLGAPTPAQQPQSWQTGSSTPVGRAPQEARLWCEWRRLGAWPDPGPTGLQAGGWRKAQAAGPAPSTGPGGHRLAGGSTRNGAPPTPPGVSEHHGVCL